MIAIAVAAALLALPRVLDVILAALSIPVFSSIGARWLVFPIRLPPGRPSSGHNAPACSWWSARASTPYQATPA